MDGSIEKKVGKPTMSGQVPGGGEAVPRRMSEAAPRIDEDNLDNVSLASSLSSTSSGGDSDGGPAEPEISVFSTSMDSRDILSTGTA